MAKDADSTLPDPEAGNSNKATPEKAPTGSGGEDAHSNKATLGTKAPTGSDNISNRDTSCDSGSPLGITPIASRSLCDPFRKTIIGKLEQGLSAQRIYQDLVDEQGFDGKYPSVRRFVAKLNQTQPHPFRRIEVAAGQEAQIDFGSGASIIDEIGQRRRTHVPLCVNIRSSGQTRGVTADPCESTIPPRRN